MGIERIKAQLEQLEEAVGALESVMDAVELRAQEAQIDMFQPNTPANDVDKEVLLQNLDSAINKVEALLNA